MWKLALSRFSCTLIPVGAQRKTLTSTGTVQYKILKNNDAWCTVLNRAVYCTAECSSSKSGCFVFVLQTACMCVCFFWIILFNFYDIIFFSANLSKTLCGRLNNCVVQSRPVIHNLFWVRAKGIVRAAVKDLESGPFLVRGLEGVSKALWQTCKWFISEQDHLHLSPNHPPQPQPSKKIWLSEHPKNRNRSPKTQNCSTVLWQSCVSHHH